MSAAQLHDTANPSGPSPADFKTSLIALIPHLRAIATVLCRNRELGEDLVQEMILSCKSVSYRGFWDAVGHPAGGPKSFPLDGAGGFGGHIVDDAVDAADFVDDARGDARKERMLEGIGIRRHAVR
jgi:hypothetical protein